VNKMPYDQGVNAQFSERLAKSPKPALNEPRHFLIDKPFLVPEHFADVARRFPGHLHAAVDGGSGFGRTSAGR
jgi:hypothetical protein